MPHRRRNFLAAAHDLLNSYLVPDAVATFDHLLAHVTTNPRQLKPPEPHQQRRLPARAGPPVRVPPIARVPPAYIRMNDRFEWIEVAPTTVTLLEVESADDLLGTAWEQYVDGPDLLTFNDHWLIATHTRQGFTCTLPFHTPTGHDLLIREWVRPMRDSRTLAIKGWFGCLQRVASVIPIVPHDQRSA